MSNTKKGGLGRGIEALLPDADLSVTEVPLSRILPNPHQPRRHFDDTELRELANSMAVHGVIQPLIVEKRDDERYTLVAGERRLRAAKLAKLSTVPVICRRYDERTRLQVALVENIQRADLNPIEEALAYRLLRDQSGATQEQIAQAVGKSRAAVTNTLRLLQLPDKIIAYLRQGQLSAGHGRALLTISYRARQLEVAARAVSQKMSVREVERLALEPDSHRTESSSGGSRAAAPARHELKAVEDRIRHTLTTKVQIQGSNSSGRVVIHYYSLEDLNRVYQLICNPNSSPEEYTEND